MINEQLHLFFVFPITFTTSITDKTTEQKYTGSVMRKGCNMSRY